LPDALIAKLDKAIDDAADDANALSREQREVQEAAILSDMLSTERREVALILEVERQNMNSPISFRAITSPQALLGGRLRTVPRGSAGTSPGLSFDLRVPGAR
jgi:hypothetical protein